MLTKTLDYAVNIDSSYSYNCEKTFIITCLDQIDNPKEFIDKLIKLNEEKYNYKIYSQDGIYSRLRNCLFKKK